MNHDLPPESVRTDHPAKSPVPAAKAIAAVARQASILVVDPAPLSLLAMAGMFHGQNYQCVCARDTATALRAIELGVQDLVVWDVADDAAAALAALQQLREQPEHAQIPAIMLAESRWAGLEKRTEASSQPTRCLFKPIDPHSLAAVAEQLLWLPQLENAHRRRGSRPSRPGWITL